MTTAQHLLLEHRLAETELETIRLRRQVEQLTAQVQRLAQAPAPPPTKHFTPPAERTIVHQRVGYAFEAKLPPVRRVIDFRSHNTHTNEVVDVDNYSASQLERACQKFSRLQFPTRQLWKGRNELYSVAKKLFAQAGAIQKHAGSNKWHWAAWPHERRAVCARIVSALSRQN